MKQRLSSLICILLCIGLGSCSLFSKEQNPVKSSDKDPQGKVIIRWRNETEHDNYGFHIYRGKTEKGPFKKINKEIIPGSGTTSTPREYVYVDQPLEIGETFYYYIEAISFAGVKEKITPVTPVVVKTVIDEPASNK